MSMLFMSLELFYLMWHIQYLSLVDRRVSVEQFISPYRKENSFNV